MKITKSIMAILFAVIMIASIVPAAVFADDVDPSQFFTADKNTITLLKDENNVILMSCICKGDHSDVTDYRELRTVRKSSDFIYGASSDKLGVRSVPVTVNGAGTYTVIVHQKDGLIHAHAFELDFEHLLPSFAADGITEIPADVRLIRYIEGDHADMTMKELKAAGANVVCNSYFSVGDGGIKSYAFKKQCVGTWTFAVQYEDGNVRNVVVNNEAIPDPVPGIIERYGITFDVTSDAARGSFRLGFYSTNSKINAQDVELKIDLYEPVNRYYTDHLTRTISTREWRDYGNGSFYIMINSITLKEKVSIPQVSSYLMELTVTINGESDTMSVRVYNPGTWLN